MAAGLGFKTFTTGEVLTAADVNGYLMQGVLVFATEAARNSAITSPQEGQFAFTKDTNSLWYYSGSAWVASGATGDIEGVTAGTGISGGGTSGTVTITNSMATAIDAKGDLVPGTGADTFSRLAVGANGTVLTADSAEATGLKWAAAGGSLTISSIASGTLSGTSLSVTSLSAYDDIWFFAKNITGSASLSIGFRINSNSTSPNYKTWQAYEISSTGYPINYVHNTSSFRLNDGVKSSGALNNVMWHLTNCKATGLTTVDFIYAYQKTDSTYVTQWGGGVYDVAEAVSSIQLVSTSGDSFTAGDYNVYGG